MPLTIQYLYEQLKTMDSKFHFGTLVLWMETYWDKKDIPHYMYLARHLPSFESYNAVISKLFQKQTDTGSLWQKEILDELERFVLHDEAKNKVEWYHMSDAFVELSCLIYLQHEIENVMDNNWIRFLIHNGRAEHLKAILYPQTEDEKKLRNIFDIVGLQGLMKEHHVASETTLYL